MTSTQRLADRLMDALPKSPLGTIAATGMGILLLAAVCVHWLGWVLSAWVVAAGVAAGAVAIWREIWRRA